MAKFIIMCLKNARNLKFMFKRNKTADYAKIVVRKKIKSKIYL